MRMATCTFSCGRTVCTIYIEMSSLGAADSLIALQDPAEAYLVHLFELRGHKSAYDIHPPTSIASRFVSSKKCTKYALAAPGSAIEQ